MLESNKPLGAILLDAGYSQSVANAPGHNVLQSKGFLALMEGLGLTDDFLSNALKEDIIKKPQNRLGELTLAYKLRGRLKDDATQASFTPATINIAIVNKPETPLNEQ